MLRLAADPPGISEAAGLIRDGAVVLWPSGGVYGLATSACSAEGVARIYRAKGRPAGKPLQVLASPDLARRLGNLPPGLERVLRDVWPGYVGFVVKRRAPELEAVSGPGDTVLLVCSNWIAAGLAVETGVPVVATSANPSGSAEIVRADEAAARFVESVDAIIDGGLQTGELNTLLDLSRRPYRVLRQGAIEPHRILAVLAETEQT